MVQPSRGEALVGAAAAGRAGAAGTGVPRRPGRVAPITWTGSPDSGLVEAVHGGVPGQGGGFEGPDDVDTRALPRIPGLTQQPGPERSAAFDAGAGAERAVAETELTMIQPVRTFVPDGADEYAEYARTHGRERGEPSRHAWYPGRRVDLGLVLLPLRAFLGGISVYAGFSKLCDPVYFDGGVRGSMMHWLQSLQPWEFAQPLVTWAESHPVGAGLGVAFTQVVVGVLAMLGLWTRIAAGVAMLLALALLLTVSWRSVPAYDAPQIVYLAAWSPLLIAGAPFFSLDGRLALDAWRRYGNQADPGVLRRRVLRRGTVLATLVIGATLVSGSLFGAAVRSSQVRRTVNPAQPTMPTQYPSPVWPSALPSPGGAGSTHGGAHRPSERPSGSAAPSSAGARSSSSGSGPTGSGSGSSTSTHHGGSAGSTSGAPSGSSGSGGGSSAPPSSGTLGGLLG